MKKLIGIFIINLLISTAILPVVGTINNEKEIINNPNITDYKMQNNEHYSILSEFKICNEIGDQKHPAISDNVVVWHDERDGFWNANIYGYDLTTKTEFIICDNSEEQIRPHIYENTVVWEDSRNGNMDIYGYDLTTDTEFSICTNPYLQHNPDVCGPIVAWVDERNGNKDIYCYNILKNIEYSVCTDPNANQNPAVWGRIFGGLWGRIFGGMLYGTILWEDLRNVNLNHQADIYGYSILLGSVGLNEFSVWRDEGRQGNPDIFGNIFIWAHWPPLSTGHDIVGFNRLTQFYFIICDHPADQMFPTIYDKLVVWEDYRNGNWDIYGYNLTTDTEFIICDNSAEQRFPVIWGNTVAWQDNREGDWDIYGALLPP